MASPSAMGAYYEDFPKPPEEPPPGASVEQLVQFNVDMAKFEEDKAAHEEEYGPPPEPDPVVPPAPPSGGGGGGGGGGGSGKPAARIGDMYAHGGAIVGFCPTVLIGGKPAARVTDMHVCPMVTGVVPHVGGPILPPGAVKVLIGGVPAARMSDKSTCVGPPDTIAQGEFTVFIG